LPDDVSTGAAVLALRIAVVIALYLFVLAVFRRLRSGLTQPDPARMHARSDGAPADWIEVIDCEEAPDLAGKLYPLVPVSSIGREQGNTVTIPDQRISSQHARLEWREGRWWVEDLDSANGTFLNGRAVGDAVPAAYGDTIRVGPAVLQLRRPRRR